MAAVTDPAQRVGTPWNKKRSAQATLAKPDWIEGKIGLEPLEIRVPLFPDFIGRSESHRRPRLVDRNQRHPE